jgi:1,4-dihydroxy-2-naphthoate octaprenyltransferase
MSKKVETIFTYTTDEGIEGNLGIDKNGKLYWNQQAVITEQKIRLQLWVNIAILVGAISTFALAVFACLEFFGFGAK